MNKSQKQLEVFLGKGALKLYSNFTGEDPCRSMISIKLYSNFFENSLWYGRSPVNLLHVFRTYFYQNIYGWLFLKVFLSSDASTKPSVKMQINSVCFCDLNMPI